MFHFPLWNLFTLFLFISNLLGVVLDVLLLKLLYAIVKVVKNVSISQIIQRNCISLILTNTCYLICTCVGVLLRLLNHICVNCDRIPRMLVELSSCLPICLLAILASLGQVHGFPGSAASSLLSFLSSLTGWHPSTASHDEGT